MDPSEGIKAASQLAQSQYVFGVLFIILLGIGLWSIKIRFDQTDRKSEEMEDKNDLIFEKMDKLHEDRQNQLVGFMLDQKTESKEREAQLMSQNNVLMSNLQMQTSSLEEMTRTQTGMQRTQEKMQESLGNLQDSFEKIESRMEQIERQKNLNKE